MKKQNFKREFSAGGVVLKKQPASSRQSPALFLLGKHSGYHKWVLPKGLIEEDEKSWQTAIRETEEEMGVKAKLLLKKPIHRERYVYWADLKTQSTKVKSQKSKVKSTTQNAKLNKNTRRVEKYQEGGGSKTKVFKMVAFYLLEYVSGDPKDHGWEMEEVGWFSYKEALEKLAFKGEEEALRKAQKILSAKNDKFLV